MGFPYFLPSVIDASSYALPACRAAFLPDSLADFPSPYLFAVRPDFLPSVPPSGNNPLGTVPATPSQFAMFLSAVACAHVYRLQSPYRPTPPTSPLRPCRLPVPILRRLDRLVAWLRDGREGRTRYARSERIGTAHDGARRICRMPYRMPVPAGHRGSGYPILILRRGKRAGCGMRVETSIGCDTERSGISHLPPKTHSRAISTRS